MGAINRIILKLCYVLLLMFHAVCGAKTQWETVISVESGQSGTSVAGDGRSWQPNEYTWMIIHFIHPYGVKSQERNGQRSDMSGCRHGCRMIGCNGIYSNRFMYAVLGLGLNIVFVFHVVRGANCKDAIGNCDQCRGHY